VPSGKTGRFLISLTFLGLLKAHSGSEEVRRIFSYFPSSQELVDRTERVLASGDMEKSLYLLPRVNGKR